MAATTTKTTTPSKSFFATTSAWMKSVAAKAPALVAKTRTGLSSGAAAKGSVGLTKVQPAKFVSNAQYMELKDYQSYQSPEARKYVESLTWRKAGQQVIIPFTGQKVTTTKQDTMFANLHAANVELKYEAAQGKFATRDEFVARGKALGLSMKDPGSGFWGTISTIQKVVPSVIVSAAGGGAVTKLRDVAVDSYVKGRQTNPEVSADPATGTQTITPDGTVSTQATNQTIGGELLEDLGLGSLGDLAQSESPIQGISWWLLAVGAILIIFFVRKV
jgi:hypothetical protein